MPSNTSASMFGGAGGRGSRVSVASLEGLRNVLRNDTERDSAPAPAAAPAAPLAPAVPVVPADDKQTLRGLNDRLSDYLGRVWQLEQENRDMEMQIDAILAKRKAPEGRNWDEVEKPLDILKKQIKEIAIDNAKLLLQINNTKLANDDFKSKLEDEKNGKRELENDLEDLKKTIEDTGLNRIHTQKEIDLMKEELDRLEKEHKEEVCALREKIKDSEVTVEIESQDSNLAEMVNNIRVHYDKLAEKNLKETDDWYQNKFETIKVVEAQNNEDLNSGKSELRELLKQKLSLEIKLQGGHSKIRHLEEAVALTKLENGQHLAPLNKVILDLEADLKEVRAEVERIVRNNKDLLCVKMKLEVEMDNYQRLIHGITADPGSLEFALEDALQSEKQTPEEKVAQQQEVVKKDTPKSKKSSPANKSTPPAAVDPLDALAGDLIKKNVVNNEAAPVAPSQKKKTSSSSSDENKDEKPEEEKEGEGEKTKA
ncbi:hypothetical protein CgunFtcFv8_018567 [Champsocephalus gunnari]|uniref:IF rod domain-containing protein n=1 Tax=Champsocephalus gunnari TaxID=52237 RepID=A0AAN8BTK6_CHAGU|nr:hypothetical protein CgunFtcFv8_018567 [Champsocephalus gunnari]